MIIYPEETIRLIADSINIADYISQYVELKKERNRLFGLCPFHKEDTPSFMVDEKGKNYHCFGCKEHGSIFKFVMKMDHISFFEAVEKLAGIANIEAKPSRISETVKLFKQLNPHIEKPKEHTFLPESILENFLRQRIVQWEDEGILPDIIDKYGVRFDKKSQRIVYPVYDNNGNLINIKGRTILEDYKTLKLPKYINYYKVGTVDYLQGLCFKKETIKRKNEVIIFEGIKSCMKAEGWGFDNVVSAETSSLNSYQIKLIIQLHCDVVIAFDKDKSVEDVIKAIDWLPKFTNVFVINDKDNLLGDKSEKNSPVDKGEEVWKKLYEQRERVW